VDSVPVLEHSAGRAIAACRVGAAEVRLERLLARLRRATSGRICLYSLFAFSLGLVGAVLRPDRTVSYTGSALITLAIVPLMPRTGLAPQIAFPSVCGMSIGIAVALILTVA
jgi:hypothetical protein